MAFLGKFKGGYQDLWKAIIRPPRDEYNIKDLGPPEFRLKGKIYKRTDIQIQNKKGLILECSHFQPHKRIAKELPCVIYLHGNSSSRVEALQAVEVLLPANITLFCFDFAGCGKSEGEFISLGWYERDDVDTIIEYLRSSGTVSTIGLWGRSMGAVTSLMHADRDPSIGGIVLDSPFSDLKLLAEELVRNHTKIPKLIVSGAMALIRSTIKSKAKFDIDSLVPMNHVAAGFVPALFVAGKDDNFIDPHHAKDLYEQYAGDKNIVIVDGDHNSRRPAFLMDSISIFFHNTLLVDQLPQSQSHTNISDNNKPPIKEKEKEKPVVQPKKEPENSKENEKIPRGGGLGFKNAYMKGKAFEPKTIGNEDDMNSEEGEEDIGEENIKEEEDNFKKVIPEPIVNVGNEDDIQSILEQIQEDELRRAIEESLKHVQQQDEEEKEEKLGTQAQTNGSKKVGSKTELNYGMKGDEEVDKRNGGLSDNEESSNQEEDYIKMPLDFPDDDKSEGKTRDIV